MHISPFRKTSVEIIRGGKIAKSRGENIENIKKQAKISLFFGGMLFAE